MKVSDRFLLRPTRKFAVPSAVWCAPSIDSRWSTPIACPSPGQRSSLQITTRGSTGSSSGRLSRGNCVSSRRRSSGVPGCSRGCSTASARSRLSEAEATTALVLQALDARHAVAIFPQGAVHGDRVWKPGAAHAAIMTGAPLVASPPRRHGTGPLAGQNRLSAVARYRRRADQSRAGPGRPGRGNGTDRTVTCRRRIAGLTRMIHERICCNRHSETLPHQASFVNGERDKQAVRDKPNSQR